MYVCHYCHGYADHLVGLTSVLLNPSTGLGQEGATRGQRTFKLLLSSLRYCKKHNAGGYHIGHILIGLVRTYGERQVI